MKKSLMALFFAILTLTTASNAFACPKGEHPHGGTGSHHKGGWCSYEQ